MKNYLFKKLLFILGIAMSTSLSAQSISGVITDSSGPLPGANVFVKNTSNGTTTDFDGKYTLENVAKDAVVVVSFLGYVSQEINADGKTTIDVSLVEDLSSLEEVVVVGYGTKKRSLVTGAISSVNSDQFQTASNQRVEQVLQGRTAGVTVSSASGSPGSGAKIRIRGTGSNSKSDPLYIVDGMKVSDISNIVPSDIANIEVFKDAASSAIYGTEGANGVIVITTKRGKFGKSVVSYNTQIGFESINTKLELMNADQFVQYMDEAGQVGIVNNGVDTNWVDATFDSGFYQRHDISFSGASDKTSYYVSGSLLDQEGILSGDNSGYGRYSFRSNIKSDVKDWLEVGANMSYSQSTNNQVSENSDTRGVVQNLLILDPLTPVTYKDGEVPILTRELAENNDVPLLTDGSGNVYGYPTYSNGEVLNPVAYANELSDIKEDVDYFVGSVYGKFKLMEGLSFTTRLGIERKNRSKKTNNIPYFVTSEAGNGNYGVSQEFERQTKWLWENFASYNKQIGNHDFTLLAGYSAEENMEPIFNASSTISPDNFTSPYLDFLEIDGNVGGSLTQSALTSIFGRFSYAFSEKYLFEASLRHDTSSLVSESGTFPAVSAGWVMSNEGFWADNNPVNFVKLRASWGQNGSISNIDGGAGLNFYQGQVSGAGLIQYEGQFGSEFAFIPNPDLTWETSEQVDVGADLRAFNNRLNFTVDYYQKTTKDLLIVDDLITPASAGAEIKEFNGGTVVNRGLEFELGWQDTTTGGFTYGVSANLSTLENEVTEISLVPEGSFLTGSGAPQNGDGITRFEEGEPIWYFYGYKTNGINEADGSIIYDSEDGTIDTAEKTRIGSPHPDLLYGGNVNLGYKGFDFNVQFQGVYGNEVVATYHQPSRAITNKPVHWFEDRWTSTNTNASMPAAEFAASAYQTDLVVEDGSFMRIKQIQFGYSLPDSLLTNVGISKLRIYVSLDDHFTFTKYRGLDPEVGSTPGANDDTGDNAIGVDRGFYPIAAKTLFGLSLEF